MHTDALCSPVFTGLVQHLGTVAERAESGAGVRLSIHALGWDHSSGEGDSISVNGVCLTLLPASEPGELAFDAIQETLDRSTLGTLEVGSRVNLEHACRADTLLGGHIVQGHVDAVGTIRSVKNDPSDWRVWIDTPPDAMRCIVPKGSVCVEGVSLTVADADDAGFEIALIPTTLEHTTLDALSPGDPVNIETDIVARQIVHWLERYAPNMQR